MARGFRNTIQGIMGRLVIQENGCALWPGAKNTGGYGAVGYQSKQHVVHKLLYEHFVGPIPEGMVLDHIVCNNPACGNFAHLRVCTPGENSLRSTNPWAENARRTHCVNGHALSGINVRIRPNGSRACRQCCRETVLRNSKKPEQQARIKSYQKANNEKRREAARRRRAAQGPVLPPPGQRTHCPQGHAYAGENLAYDPGGGRYCRECRRQRARETYWKNR